MSDVPAIFEVMNEVKRAVGVIGKDDRNEHFGFNFRGIDSVFNAFHRPMVDHGLNAVPHNVYDVEYVESGDAVRCRLKMTIRIYAPDGSYVDADGAGEAIDTQDKATAQASQQAYKYTLLQAFTVPTEDMEDSDAAGPVEPDGQHQTLLDELDSLLDTAEGMGLDVDRVKATGHAAHSADHARFVTGKLTERIDGAHDSVAEQTHSPGAGQEPDQFDADAVWLVVDRLRKKLAVPRARMLTHARLIVGQDDLEGQDGTVWADAKDVGPDAHPQVLRGLRSWLEDLAQQQEAS